jgi:hypothetical protein
VAESGTAVIEAGLCGDVMVHQRWRGSDGSDRRGMDFPNPPYIFRAPQVYPRPECMQVMFIRALDVGLCSIFKRYGGILLSFVDLLLLH